MNRPCGCGDRLSDAPTYRATLGSLLGSNIRALKMEREFVLRVDNQLVKGLPGEYLCQNENGVYFKLIAEEFERLYVLA